MVTFNLKIISIKSVYTSNITFINPWNALFGLKSLKKMLVVSLYWFATQEQTGTCRRQKFRSIYSKFSVEENELTPSFQNPQEVA